MFQLPQSTRRKRPPVKSKFFKLRKGSRRGGNSSQIINRAFNQKKALASRTPIRFSNRISY